LLKKITKNILGVNDEFNFSKYDKYIWRKNEERKVCKCSGRIEMANLLEETKEAIKGSGHKVKDILFIGSEETGHNCTWKEFGFNRTIVELKSIFNITNIAN